jgi:hypothetical protein
MNEQRKQILEMLAEGKISADEAESLIAALEREQQPQVSPVVASGPRPKYMRVLVESQEGLDGQERGTVNVRVPIALLRAGVKLATLIPPQALAKANDELARSGVPIDLTQLKPQDVEELIEHLADLTVDIDQPDAKVRVFCE